MNRYEIWIAFMTIVIREVRRFLRIWPQTIIPPVVTMALFFSDFWKCYRFKNRFYAGTPL